MGKKNVCRKNLDIYRMFVLTEGNIADIARLKAEHIDTVVNAATPTLMDSGQGVDGALHKALDRLLGGKGKFDKQIRSELGSKERETIRCRRGEAVLTSGLPLCKNIIHCVGAVYDGSPGKKENCSSSRIETLESCYLQIVELLKTYTGIRRIAIPIIGAGRYGFPFALAARIAVAGIANALIEWKEQDAEMFEMAGIEKIYFFVYEDCKELQEEHLSCLETIMSKYLPFIKRERRFVFQNSGKAHFRYMREIQRYDEKRGYFSVAKAIRLLLMAARVLFFPLMLLKDAFGGIDWKKRRLFVEILAFLKVAAPLIFYLILSMLPAGRAASALGAVFAVLVVYSLCDTLTYLLTLILMADIQRPSANIIRSMLMLFVNYFEAAFDTALLYWLLFREKLRFGQAVMFGLTGERQVVYEDVWGGDILYCFSIGIRFFFFSLVFGYLADHMKKRKFKG